MTPDLVYKIALIKIPGIGAVTARNLVSYCGGAKEVFESKKKELLKIPNIGAITADLILQQKVLTEAEKDIFNSKRILYIGFDLLEIQC